MPRDLLELRVAFTTDMQPKVCVVTPCGDSGVCCTAARWRSPRELVIAPEHALLPHHHYVLELGALNKCRLSSASGQPLPVTRWTFETQ